MHVTETFYDACLWCLKRIQNEGRFLTNAEKGPSRKSATEDFLHVAVSLIG